MTVIVAVMDREPAVSSGQGNGGSNERGLDRLAGMQIRGNGQSGSVMGVETGTMIWAETDTETAAERGTRTGTRTGTGTVMVTRPMTTIKMDAGIAIVTWTAVVVVVVAVAAAAAGAGDALA
mmetsp:Transcript_55524/g.98938  ORF Transcript_55524/g.98938 Transcript_55524/m.98938 type:complete len:122 (+) Transcript_55524:150-515(+)